jgi:hypothetical protein
VAIAMSRYVYMEAIYPNQNAYKFFELTQSADGKEVQQRYGRIDDAYINSGRIAPGGRSQPLKSSKYGNSPYGSKGGADYAIDATIYDKQNHRKTPYKILIDSDDEKPRGGSTKSVSKVLASMGVINHSMADGW